MKECSLINEKDLANEKEIGLMYKSKKFTEDEIKNALKLMEDEFYSDVAKKTGISVMALKKIAMAEGDNLVSFEERINLWNSIIGSIDLSIGKFGGPRATIGDCKKVVRDDIREALESGKRLEEMNDTLQSIWNEAV